MERINSRLDAIQHEINNLDQDKREKKFFLTLDTLEALKIEIMNLKDEYEQSFNGLNKVLSQMLKDTSKNISKLITEIEVAKKKFQKIGNIILLKI